MENTDNEKDHATQQKERVNFRTNSRGWRANENATCRR